LRKEGWQVVAVANGKEALVAIAANQPQLIVSDLMMPEMDGFELVYELRQNPQWRSIPVIIVTAKELNEIERQQLKGHVQKIFQKGVYQRQILLDELNNLLSEAISRQRSKQKLLST
jgi:CheY-like chemotaxis protein